MATVTQIRRFRRVVIYIALILLGLFFLSLILADRFVEPVLRQRLHTLIVKGSDSLYTYQLGDLKANFLHGRVEVRNLQINIDSNRYQYLKERNKLPALTMELDLAEGSITGVNLLGLLLRKKIDVEEFSSKKADVRLERHLQSKDPIETDEPLWKSIQPDIRSIEVDRVRLEGIKLSYKNADTAESINLQFDQCNALFDNIRIDSAAAFDTTRIGFAKNISLNLHDLKFRTPDSTYKMEAERITYSSREHLLQIDSFSLQPTLDKADFYKANPVQQSLYYVVFRKARFINMPLDRFINKDVISADSVIVEKPDVNVYLDRNMQPLFISKVGKFPHQKLLSSPMVIDIKSFLAKTASVVYTERSTKTLHEGKVFFTDFDLVANNVVNDQRLIESNSICTAFAEGKILGSSPFSVNFTFFLDSLNGCYEADGSIREIKSSQLNPAASNLGNIEINGLNIHQLDFKIRGRDMDASGSLRMRYDNLAVTLRKLDKETGEISERKFFSRVMNQYTLWPSNPGPNGVERITNDAKALRLTSQSFFALLWKTIFDGMQDIMMKK